MDELGKVVCAGGDHEYEEKSIIVDAYVTAFGPTLQKSSAQSDSCYRHPPLHEMDRGQ